jgi:hypothetical protein
MAPVSGCNLTRRSSKTTFAESGDRVMLSKLAGGRSDIVVSIWNLSPAFIYRSWLSDQGKLLPFGSRKLAKCRSGMATSESPDQEPTPEDRYLEKMREIIRSHTHQERINTLFLRIKSRLPDLEETARELEEAEEDGVYRFYRRVASSTRHGGGALPF